MENEKVQNGNSPILTNLQRKILQLSAEGKSVKEISFILDMDEFKIGIFRHILLRKFEMSDMDQLVIMASENGFIR